MTPFSPDRQTEKRVQDAGAQDADLEPWSLRGRQAASKAQQRYPQSLTSMLIVLGGLASSPFFFFFFCSFFSELGTEPRALRFLGKRSTTELNPQPQLSLLTLNLLTVKTLAALSLPLGA
ncbi:rCG34236 [Rattus norvegicus]|uniref:RCG34236 n=1 Tax=Rattus norvegicus TaxID=10116 RepID=A6HIR6_RAT|nr:rCG34236 [Rattus norvegicus]